MMQGATQDTWKKRSDSNNGSCTQIGVFEVEQKPVQINFSSVDSFTFWSGVYPKVGDTIWGANRHPYRVMKVGEIDGPTIQIWVESAASEYVRGGQYE